MRVPALSSVATWLGAAALSVAPLASLASPRCASAAPDTPATTATRGGLRGYQARLEAESLRILGAEVSGGMKQALGRRGTWLWACVSIREWQRIVTSEAPPLARACEVLARRSEVLWTEERVSDAYTLPLVQMASVHAMQRGLVRVLAQLGVESTPPPAPKPTPTEAPTAVPPGRAPVVAMNLAPAAPPHRPHATAATPAPAAKPAVIVLSPAELLAYGGALERETYRILVPEVEGAVLDAVVAHRAALRATTTVAQWKAALVAAHPALTKAAAVLERRTEVLRGEQRVRDAYDAPPTQQAAVRGLQAGLDRLLRQFGR